MPHGTGKDVRVAVFAQGEKAEEATAAGADIVGMEDLAETVKGGDDWILMWQLPLRTVCESWVSWVRFLVRVA